MALNLRSTVTHELRQTVWGMAKRLWCCKRIKVGLELRMCSLVVTGSVSGCPMTTVPAYHCQGGLGAAEWAPAKRSWCRGISFHMFSSWER